MSEESHKTKPKHSEHGTTQSYVIGFIFSLIFTIIPYYLVVNKVLSGNALMFTILGIAIYQMLIQIIFFLHLGRGPKPFYNVVFFFGTAGILIVVISASLFIMNNLYRNMSPKEVTVRIAQEEAIDQVGGEKTGACNENKESHIFTISDGIVSPFYVIARRCDTITFINKDDVERKIAFGNHPDDISYGGLYEIVLDDDRPETITLNETGDFLIHDHEDVDLLGRFVVSP